MPCISSVTRLLEKCCFFHFLRVKKNTNFSIFQYCRFLCFTWIYTSIYTWNDVFYFLFMKKLVYIGIIHKFTECFHFFKIFLVVQKNRTTYVCKLNHFLLHFLQLYPLLIFHFDLTGCFQHMINIRSIFIFIFLSILDM